jgi:hypothetical protein
MADFTEEQIRDVWEKGKEIEGYDFADFRKDVAGAFIKRDNLWLGN